MLPEGNGLEELVRVFQISKYNTFGLIQALGQDISGGLIILQQGHSLPTSSSFRVIEENELTQRLDSRADLGLVMWDKKPRLSVAGIQDKINVYINAENQIGFGGRKLCSTHLMKFEKRLSSHLVLNEYVTMRLASRCGLQTANVKLLRYAEHSVLLVERFDRARVGDSVVKRRHIIDGCQALNLSPDYKYERNFGSGRDVAHVREGASLPKLFELARQCQNPAFTIEKITDWSLFNLLTFNFDAHGKNISFIVDSKGISLAPFYGLVNIKLYPQFEHDMAMALGDEFDGDVVNAYQLADFAESCQLSRSWLAGRFKQMSERVMSGLESIIDVDVSAEEKQFLQQYQALVRSQCKHLDEQASEILSIML